MSKGFSLLELMIVITIIAIASSVIVPNLRNRIPAYNRKQFITHINALTLLAWQNAILRHKVHRVLFDFVKRTIVIQTEQEDKGKKEFKTINVPYLYAFYAWPDNINIKNFFVRNIDEMNKGSGFKTTMSWFFITPEGVAQDAIINISDSKDKVEDKERQIGLVLNPFTAQFKEYDTFQRPVG